MTSEVSLMSIFGERVKQKYRTLNWPYVEPRLSPVFRGLPEISASLCNNCGECQKICPTQAIDLESKSLDMGKCIFCGDCANICPAAAINFGLEYRLASPARQGLIIQSGAERQARKNILAKKGIFGRSFKLRQVSAGGCNACEADCNVLGTLVYDLGKFGIEFTASPRHADAIVLTGPITRNMLPAFLDAWLAVPDPAVLIAVGACAISGGLFQNMPDCSGGMDGCEAACASMALDYPKNLKPTVYIPGCPPNPWTILEGLLMARTLANAQ